MPSDQSSPVSVGVEMRQGRPWWKACLTGCLLVVVAAFFIFSAMVRGFGGSGPRAIAALPSNFPSAIVPFHLEQAKSIEYLEGAQKDKFFSTIMSPFRFFGGVMMTTQENGTSTNGFDTFMNAGASRLQSVDTVTIHWNALPYARNDLEANYLSQFQQNGFTVDTRRDAATETDTIVASRGDARAQLQVQDLPDRPNIESVVLVVDYSNAAQK